MAYALNTQPDGWLICNGQAVSSTDMGQRALYDALVAAGYPYGSSNGHPLVPDLRGEFIRGLDSGRGVDPDNTRGIGTVQGDAIRNITGEIHSSTEFMSHKSGAFSNSVSDSSARNEGYSTGGKRFKFDASLVVPTAPENRPRNMALNFLIKL